MKDELESMIRKAEGVLGVIEAHRIQKQNNNCDPVLGGWDYQFVSRQQDDVVRFLRGIKPTT